MPLRPSIFLFVTLVAACATSRPGPAKGTAPHPPPGFASAAVVPVTSDAAPPVFAITVQPILARRCAPCHNPGGRMYERLPFDDPGVILANREGVARRLKDPQEKLALERWLETAGGGG